MSHYPQQPYGRVSARDRDRRRAGGWDLRFAILMVFPLICLVVVLYEFLYLQQYTASDSPASAIQERSARLRSDDPVVASTAPATPKPTTVINGRSTMVLIANYRDSKRCAGILLPPRLGGLTDRLRLMLLLQMRRDHQVHLRQRRVARSRAREHLRPDLRGRGRAPVRRSVL